MIQDLLSKMGVSEDGELVIRMQPEEVSLLEEAAYGTPETAGEKEWGVWSVKAARKKAGEDEPEEDEEDDDAVADDEDDDWEKGDEEEEEDEWDPDFDEFDIPKSTKKAGGKKDADEEEDIKFDEDLNEFDDLFGDGGDDFDDDDDF